MAVKDMDVKVSELTDAVSPIGEPHSWLSTVFELVERLIGTEMAVKDTDVKVSELTDAVLATNEKLINNVQLL